MSIEELRILKVHGPVLGERRVKTCPESVVYSLLQPGDVAVNAWRNELIGDRF